MGRRGGGGIHRARPALAAVYLLVAYFALAVFTGCGGEDGEVSETPSSASPTATRSASAGPAITSPPAATDEPRPVAATAEPTPAPTPTAPPQAQPPARNGLLTVVDKQHALAAGYVPPDLAPLGAAYLAPGFGGSLRAEVKAALEGMLSDAYDQGHDMYARSAYRSYAEQERTFAYWVSALGEAEARRVSAEPGHSEHQLGTAADLTNADVGYDLTEAFGDTPGGRWLAENGHRYGFALSYPAGAEAVTGYAYEPWHYRYIGAEHAAAWRAGGLTLGEYLRGLEG